ncbi:MAG: selenium-dependent molybdenum cofactor biosynthesis protein YqeB [Pseudomonadota bacterium]
MGKFFSLKVLIKGAGEMASGVGSVLHRAGFRVAFTEIRPPLCVRRTVSFCEALYGGRMKVEDLEAVLASDIRDIETAWDRGVMAVVVDPDMSILSSLKPDMLIDATVAKKNLGLRMDMAELTVGLGPGFSAGRDVHVVVETNRGHDLGRLIHDGAAAPNTGEPGLIAGQSVRRVLRAPIPGRVETDLEIGAMVREGQEILRVDGRPVQASLTGVLRGLIRPGSRVEKA